MRNSSFTIVLIFILSFSMHSQSLDTLVDVGGYNMHFKIMKGEGTPILFDSGAGNDGSVWNGILESIHKVTGTTLITYDRSGFGKSELNPNESDDNKFGILNGMKELETGLELLGFDDDIILVSHSYGGFYNTLYSARHPEKVKYVVMIDASIVEFYTDDIISKWFSTNPIEKTKENLGHYYLMKNLRNSVKIMKETEFPSDIPVIDIVSAIPWLEKPFTDLDWQSWLDSHKNFVSVKSNIKGITAYGSAHYIFIDNPGLIINTVIKAYSETMDEDQQNDILKKALENAIELSIEAKKIETENLHSEDDLNDWGYSLMESEELEKALEVFKLNTILFPDSWNVYDSYGEALMKSNRKEESIEMYEKSIAMNPENENGKEMLLKIKQE